MSPASWMRISTERAAPVVAAVVLLGGAIGLAASCTGGASVNAPADAGHDARADSVPEAVPETGTGGAPDAANDADAAPACDPDPHSALVPKGWVRFPGLPCQCTVWLAPSQELMTPAPKWVQEAGGWLELDDPQAGDPYTTGVPHGDGYAGVQEIAYQRILEAGVQENVVLHVGAGRYVFDERVIGDVHYNAPCWSVMNAAEQGVVSHESWVSTSGIQARPDVLSFTMASDPVPHLAQQAVNNGYRGWGVGAGVLAVSPMSTDNIDAFTLDPVHAYPSGWVSDGRMLGQMFGWDSTLFFGAGVLGSPPAWQELTWDPVHGVRPLLGTGPGQNPASAICGLGTDGKTLVWKQLDGWDGTSWQQSRLMQAPFTTDAAKLTPEVLRDAPGIDQCAGVWVVGGGYAAAALPLDAQAKTYATFVVRLSDGAEWKLDTPGVDFQPLYLTDTEMGALKAYDKPIPGGPDGFTGYRIARYPLSLLGAPNVP